MRTVLVTHPGLQHSHQLALALHEKSLLQSFWSGVPVASASEPAPWWLPESYRKKVRRVDIPGPMRRHPARFQLALKALHTFPRGDLSSDATHGIFHWFDAWAARQIYQTKPKVVVAYENAAYHTFKAAKAVGARCVLDAAAFHHLETARLVNEPFTRYTPEINRRKDEEVRMADLILTCSPLAAESYVAHGIPADKLRPLVLGAEMPTDLPEWQPTDGAPRFVFAGPLSRRKAVDVIVEAFRKLHADGLRYDLQFVGGVGDAALLQAVNETPNAHHVANLPQRELFPKLAQADCLVLPSRSDSFGMVVAEAMACGTPALVSTQTGAKAMIEAHPGSGWIVEPEVEPLYAALRKLIENPSLMHEARAVAKMSGQAYSWASYRSRAGQLFQEYVQ